MSAIIPQIKPIPLLEFGQQRWTIFPAATTSVSRSTLLRAILNCARQSCRTQPATAPSLTPFGGGSSVCGGVEPRVDGIRYKAAVTLDLRNLGNGLEVDRYRAHP
jgi:hypothetical protein